MAIAQALVFKAKANQRESLTAFSVGLLIFRTRSFGIFRNKNIFRNIFQLVCSWEQRPKMRIASKRTLTRTILYILIPD